VDVRSRVIALIAAGLLSMVAISAEAQIRVVAFPSSVTASGHPLSVWVTVHNDGDEPVELVVGGAEERTDSGSFSPLTVSGFEADGGRPTGRAFVVPAHRSVRLVVFVGGFSGERHRAGYDARVTVCPLRGATTSCVTGDTRVTRAYRDPIRH
jgi:hypothetical protein